MNINKDYIGVIKELHGQFTFKQILIPQETILIDNINAMRDNPNRTIFDMQDAFEKKYPENIYKHKYYDYLYPFGYLSSYIGTVGYPNLIKYEEYKERVENKEKELIEKYLESDSAKAILLLQKQISEDEYNKELANCKEKIKKELQEYKLSLKKRFDPARFIYACNYYAKIKEINPDKSIKMYSTDNIGWSNFIFKISEDITIHLKSNFGYGSASYFHCNLIYKGINITPYTAIVNYCYVNWQDFIRYTRNYKPDRDNWDLVLEFVAETSNLAKTDPKEFVEVWIINELKEMMTGLRSILNSPNANINKYLNLKDEISITNYTHVRNFNFFDKEEYKILPQEKIIAFKAEKITGCLFLLEKLRKITEISSYINSCIDEIISMNKTIKPEILEHINFVSKDINNLESRKEDYVRKMNKLVTKIKLVHEPLINKRLTEMNERAKPLHVTYPYEKAEREYENSNSEYSRLKMEVKNLNEKITSINKDITLRNKFINILNKCLDRINVYVLAS